MQIQSCKFNSSNQKWNNETCRCECKNYRTCKKNYSRNPSISISGNDKYLKSITDEITYVTDIVPTDVTNTITKNVTSVVSRN